MATDVRWTSSGDTAYNTAGNWSDNAVPEAGDTTRFTHSSVSVAGYDHSAVILNAPVHITSTYTGLIGNAAGYGAAGTPLKLNASEYHIGAPVNGIQGPGSRRINLDTHTTNCLVNVIATSMQSADPDMPPVRLLMAHSSATLRVARGRVGLACLPTQTSTISAAYVGSIGGGLNDCEVIIGAGTTIATFEQNSGLLWMFGSPSGTCNIYGGTCILDYACTAGTYVVWPGATLIMNAKGTITAITVHDGAFYDESQSDMPRTVTTLTLNGNALRDAKLNKSVTKTTLTTTKSG